MDMQTWNSEHWTVFREALFSVSFDYSSGAWWEPKTK